MKTEIEFKEVAHLYLKCWGEVSGIEEIIDDFTNGEWSLSADLLHLYLTKQCDFKPHLSRLSSLIEEHAVELVRLMLTEGETTQIDVWSIDSDGFHFAVPEIEFAGTLEFHKLSPAQFLFLLSKHYWLWDNSAFDNGSIIEKNKG